MHRIDVQRVDADGGKDGGETNNEGVRRRRARCNFSFFAQQA